MKKCTTLTVVFFNNSTLQTRIYIPTVVSSSVDDHQYTRPNQLSKRRRRSGYKILDNSMTDLDQTSSSSEELAEEEDEEMEYIPMKPCLAVGRSRSLPFIKPLQRLDTLRNLQGQATPPPTLKVGFKCDI